MQTLIKNSDGATITMYSAELTKNDFKARIATTNQELEDFDIKSAKELKDFDAATIAKINLIENKNLIENITKSQTAQRDMVVDRQTSQRNVIVNNIDRFNAALSQM